MQYCVVDGVVTPIGLKTRAGIEGYCAIINTERCTTLVSDNCISLNGGCTVKIGQCGSDGTYSTISNGGVWTTGNNICQAFYASPGSTPTIEGMVGGDGDIIDYAVTTGENAVNWPILDGVATLTCGGIVTVCR